MLRTCQRNLHPIDTVTHAEAICLYCKLKHIKLRDEESTVMDNTLTYQLPKTLFHL